MSINEAEIEEDVIEFSFMCSQSVESGVWFLSLVFV